MNAPVRNLRPLPSIAGKVPPNDLAAEAAVLSSCILRNDRIPEVASTLTAEDFYSPQHASMWRAVIGLHESGKPVDSITIASWLNDRDMLVSTGGAAAILRIIDETPSVANVDEHARIIVRKAQRRRAIAEAHAILAEGYTDVDDEATWLEGLGGRLEACVGVSETQCLEHMGDVLRTVFSQLVASIETPPEQRATTGARLGLAALDEHFGPLTGGKVTYIAGYPGDGKTTLALQSAVATASQPQSAALIISAEMPSADLALRGLFQHARVDAGKSRLNHLRWLSQTEWRELADAASELNRLPIWFDSSSATNPARIRASVRKAKAKASRAGLKLRLVVVDYLQLIRAVSLRKNANREEEISSIAQDLKNLAKAEDVHVLALAQLNDEGRKEKRRPQARDMRESKAVEAHADCIVLIYNEAARERAKNPIQKGQPPPKEPEDVELIIDKGRGIPKGTINAIFWPHLVRFEDSPDWQSNADEGGY